MSFGFVSRNHILTFVMKNGDAKFATKIGVILLLRV